MTKHRSASSSHSPPWQRRGGRDSHKNAAKPRLMERRGGWFNYRLFGGHRTTPSALAKEASRHLITAPPPVLCHTAVQIPGNAWPESQDWGGSEASHPLRGAVFAWVAQPGVVHYSLTHPWLISDHTCRRGKPQPGRADRKLARGGAFRDTPGYNAQTIAPQGGCEANLDSCAFAKEGNCRAQNIARGP
jgi:hypothetical protein